MNSGVRGLLLGLAAVAATGAACQVSTTGLGPLPDGAAGGAGGTPVCPAGLVEQASWPAKTSATSCVRPCGPDEIGWETCGQTTPAECQKESGCVCQVDPCAACGRCAFVGLPDCYLPTNAASAPPCAAGVSQGGACGPACDRRLCLRSDGKTACVCNREGKYACADWDGAAWQ